MQIKNRISAAISVICGQQSAGAWALEAVVPFGCAAGRKGWQSRPCHPSVCGPRGQEPRQGPGTALGLRPSCASGPGVVPPARSREAEALRAPIPVRHPPGRSRGRRTGTDQQRESHVGRPESFPDGTASGLKAEHPAGRVMAGQVVVPTPTWTRNRGRPRTRFHGSPFSAFRPPIRKLQNRSRNEFAPRPCIGSLSPLGRWLADGDGTDPEGLPGSVGHRAPEPLRRPEAEPREPPGAPGHLDSKERQTA